MKHTAGSHGTTSSHLSAKMKLSKKIRKVLADDISVRLLSMAHEGFLANESTYASMNLSRKRYYLRLSHLCQLQFIEKSNNVYTITTLGKMVFKTQVRMIEELSENIVSINLIEKIKTDRNLQQIGKDKIDKIAMVLLDDTSVLRGIFADFNKYPLHYDLEVLSDYETSIAAGCKSIANAKSRVIIVSRFIHSDAVREMMRAANQNKIEVLTIVEESILAKRISDLNITSKDQLERNASLVFPTGESGVKYRYSSVDYTFMVIDDLVSIIEILSPFDHQFFLALKFNSKEISERLKAIFASMWQEAALPYDAALNLVRKDVINNNNCHGGRSNNTLLT